MIPNAVASTGPYAGLWSHLKSMDYALARAMTARSSKGGTELDRDRLRALIDFLKSGLESQSPDLQAPASLLAYVEQAEPNYGSAIDLRQRLTAIPDFQNWQRDAKKGVDAKIARLIKSIENYLEERRPSQLFPEIPQEEFRILRSILKSLLADAEAALR